MTHLNKLSKADNFLKCYGVRKLDQEANGSSGGSIPSRCNSFLACLIAFAFQQELQAYRFYKGRSDSTARQ